MAGHQLAHRGDAGQKAAGEDVALDKIDAFAVVAIALILDGDRLQGHSAARTQARLAGAEEGRQVALAHRLNHLHRHQFVVLAAQIAVVAEQHLDAILQPGAGHALGSPAVLFPGKGGSGDPAAVMAAAYSASAPQPVPISSR